MFDSFVHYQSSLIQVFDDLAEPYGFQVIDASPPVIFASLQASISKVLQMEVPKKKRTQRKVTTTL